jgi:2-methylisocitrate lyase-like PEP mutase family enzyme
VAVIDRPSGSRSMTPMPDFTSRRAAFRTLHASGCFVIPNPWDPGSARYLRRLGFPALATTSAGFAFSRGLTDQAAAALPDAVLAHIEEIVAAVDVPVNADFGSGLADDPQGVAANVRRCVETGVAGLSIEDATGDRRNPLYDLPAAIQRITAARAAIDATGADVLLTARAECYLTGHAEPFKESMRRLEAYAAAGADVLYAPGITSPADIKTMAAAFSPKPVNLLVSRNIGVTVADLAAIGVRRISVGSTLARVAWTGFMRAADALAREGSFKGFDDVAPFAEINNLFAEGAGGE